MFGYRTRPASLDDAPAIAALVATCDFLPEDPDRAAAELQRPGVASILVFDGPDLVARAWVDRRAAVDVHPAHRGRGLGAALLDWVQERAGNNLTQTVPDADLAACALLRSRGWEPFVTEWLLEADLAAEPEVPEPPVGVQIRTFQPGDARAAHQVIEDAFAEWQQRRRPYAEWARMTVEHSGFVPECSPAAFDGDRMIGVVISLSTHIERVAVHRDFRGRGIARALLRQAFHGYYRRGERACRLWTHSETGALSLYERVGMKVRRSNSVFRKALG